MSENDRMAMAERQLEEALAQAEAYRVARAEIEAQYMEDLARRNGNASGSSDQ